MSSRPPLRRLIELPGVADLEFRAVMKREFAEPEARAEFPELDEVSRALFGLTADEAEAVARPAGWDGIETQAPAKQVFAFEDAGWDVTDDKRRPLRILGHFNQQLWLALRGVAGELPFAADAEEGWVAKLEADAKRFIKR
ncbi:MAG: hypothetical protein BGN86_05430 [Caulobacterales bacterium 68-7]|nr:hypothetical protein [Caulobacterales bacterium]OJU10831.1 MAG: hypothetical protein BGN86_05430 [Caulobacterales bacterium 68-7]